MSEQFDPLKKLAIERGVVAPDEPAAPESGGGHVADILNSKVPKVRLPGDAWLLSQFAREMGRILGNKFMYRRGATVLMVNEQDQKLEPVTANAFRSLVEQRLICIRQVGHKEATFTVMQTMEKEVAQGCLAAPEFLSQLPLIERVNTARLPVLRAGGKIELLPEGYDLESRTYTFKSGIEYDETMTLDQGVDILTSLTSEFPFGDWPEIKSGETGPIKPSRSQAVVIAGMLTMFAGGLLPRLARKPAFVYTSNSVGSGKTLLAQMATASVIGEAATKAWPAREEELQKLLDTTVQYGKPYLLFDNLRGMLKSSSLEAFITSSTVTGRVLGGSAEFTCPNMTVVFVTGNGVTLSEDMDRRSLYVELFVEEADVQKRKITREIDDNWVAMPANRSKILSAMWAMVRDWDGEGRDQDKRRPHNTRRFASFAEWGRVIGGIVQHAGLGDCIERVDPERGGATESIDIRSLVRLLADKNATLSSTELEFGVLVKTAVDGGLFEWMLEGEDPEDMSPKAKSGFGKMLRRWQGRTFDYPDGLTMRFGLRGKHRGRRYTLARIAEPTISPEAAAAARN